MENQGVLEELEFVPCDRHEAVPAVNFDVNNKGAVVFQCLDCAVN